jgi:putative tricarboxylic transport membrane protein
METSLGQSLLMSQGSPFILFTRPISAVFMGLAFLSIGRGIWIEARSKSLEVAIDDPD